MSHEWSLRRSVADALAQVEMFAAFSSAFEVEEIATLPHSRVARVRIPTGATLIYKSSRPGFVYLAACEARFYRAMASEWAPALIPRCHLAIEDSDSATLLLEDIATTHRPCGGAIPTLSEATAFIEALGRIHGAALGCAALADRWTASMQEAPNNTVAGRMALLPALTSRFMESNSNVVSSACRRLLLRIAAIADAPDRLFAERTILHGDAHYWNALYAPNSAVLLDWGSTCLGPGEVDVAHALALNLPARQRRDWQERLLAAYDAALASQGVPREINETFERYRVGILYAVTVPMRQWAGGVPQHVWRPLLENAAAAAADLDVDSLL